MDRHPTMAPPSTTSRPLATGFLFRLAALLLAWGALSEGAGFWPWGVGAAAAVALLSQALVPPEAGRLALGLRLVILFPLIFRDSLLSGWDIARRAFRADPDLQPGLELVQLERPDTAVAIALAYATTLMPGSLAVEVNRRRLLVHVVDRRRDDCRAIVALERRLTKLRETGR